jgi:hypothetical protein
MAQVTYPRILFLSLSPPHLSLPLSLARGAARGGRYTPPVHGAVQTAVGVRKTSVLDVMRRLLQVRGYVCVTAVVCGESVSALACERMSELLL